jgi:hypothetical protein
MMKEHNTLAGKSLAAGSRCQILTDAIQRKSDIFSGSSKYDALEEAEALA